MTSGASYKPPSGPEVAGVALQAPLVLPAQQPATNIILVQVCHPSATDHGDFSLR